MEIGTVFVAFFLSLFIQTLETIKIMAIIWAFLCHQFETTINMENLTRDRAKSLLMKGVWN
jgi:hypothetical protein